MDPTRNRLRRVAALPCLRWRSTREVAVPALLAVAVCLWYRPTLVGEQPAGGDVTAFFYPLMTSYARSLAEGNWPPLWNDRWGFGFPALAESQMGVFYPLHLALFSVFSPARAFSLNLLVNMLLAAWFAYWAGRTIGLGPMGAGFCGLIFFAGDFFTTHAPHQWAYTTGCWFPLAVLLAWQTLGLPRLNGSKSEPCGIQAPARQDRRRWSGVLPAALLSAVLAVQMFGGHFQLAFYTHVTVLLLALSNLFLSSKPWTARLRGAGLVGAAWIGSLLLAAAQLLPTAELAYRSTFPAGDYEYLSGFANTPWHLVNYLAGSLFHSSPLWRGVVWSPSMPGAPDPWRTAPEECLNYVGLIPLCLVVGGWRCWGRQVPTRLCAAMLAIALLLSLGPYVPGFALLIRLPGFAWFRSAARWNLATTFWMAVLAGAALEQLSSVELRRAIKTFAGLWLVLMAMLVALLWTASRAEVGQHQILRQMHTSPDPTDVYVVARLVEQGHSLDELRATWPRLTLADRWPSLLLREIGPYAAILAAMTALCFLPRLSNRRLKVALVAVTVADLALLSTVRPLGWQPLGSLQNSTVLRALAQRAGSGRVRRTVDSLRNLPLVAGAAPVLAYRTLDVPAFPTVPLVALAEVGRHRVPAEVAKVFHLSGIETVIHAAVRPAVADPAVEIKAVSDPVLVAALFGQRYADQASKLRPGLVEYYLLHWQRTLAQAWTLAQPRNQDSAGTLQRLPEPQSVQRALVERSGPNHVVVEASVDAPAVLVLTDLYYPGWEATLETGDSKRAAAIENAFGAWRAIALPRAGRYRATLRYRPRPFAWGVRVSAAAWSAWLLLVAAAAASWRRKHATIQSVPASAASDSGF